MAGSAQRLVVGGIPHVTAQANGDDMVDERGKRL